MSTLYNGAGGQAGARSSPSARPGPTGIVFNTTGSGFTSADGTAVGSSRFIFDGEDGVLRGWNPTVDGHARARRRRWAIRGAIYKGLAIAATAATELFAADFHNNKVDVFDSDFEPRADTASADPGLPERLRAVRHPGDRRPRLRHVTRKQDADAEDEVAGQGRGFVDVYDTVREPARARGQHGQLNAPWGLALAPAELRPFARRPARRQLRRRPHQRVRAGDQRTRSRTTASYASTTDRSTIDGLWALQFGQGGNNGTAGTLFFTAGPNDEAHGLFGRIQSADGAMGGARYVRAPPTSSIRSAARTVPGCDRSRL